MNDKIAKWILNGRFPKDLSEPERKAYGVFTYRNNKPVDDIDAVVLLPVLVNRGFCPELYYTVDSEGFAAWYFSVNPTHSKMYFIGQTVAEAICAAIVVLSESI